jgi:predicted nuclease of predicted toxin-antitoxin system
MQMKFKVDENLPVEAAELLRKAGYDALTIYDEKLAGTRDPKIARICQEENRALITMDTDFADIGAYPPGDYSGFIVLRLKRQDKRYVIGVLSRLIKLIPTERLEQQLWIVDENRIRVRE